MPEEANFIIAEDVRSLTFSYYDGSSWNDTWDGTQAGADGTTPIGPPVAIAITITLAPPNSTADSEVGVKTYRQTVNLPTANGALTLQNGGNTFSPTSSTGQ